MYSKLLSLFMFIMLVFMYAPTAWTQTTVFDLGQVVVEAQEGSLKDSIIQGNTVIKQEQLKAYKIVDLSEILSDEMIEASMIRKSGYGNEVGLRGFTKSDLRFTQDDTLIEGSCGSRKDPPLSHINMLKVKKLEVKQGPYDVTIPGALGGNINVITKNPQEGFHGEFLSKFGSYGFLSQGGYVTGGHEKVQGLFGYNYSESDQYEDGDGNKLTNSNSGYTTEGKNKDAFEKHDFWGKISIDTAENQNVLISSSYGEAVDVLTPTAGMDIEEEKSYFNKIDYTIHDLSSISEQLKLSAYYNRIEHYPSGKYRTGGTSNKRNEAVSSITGVQIENTTLTDWARLTYGTDFYHRNWYGNVLNRTTGALLNGELIPDVDDLNYGIYLKAERDIGQWAVSAGLRLDMFHHEANEELKFSKTVTSTNDQTDVLPAANVFLKYFFSEDTNLFGGIGLTNRMPTSVERYIQGNASFYGNPDLKPSRNLQTDLGFETKLTDRLTFQTKGFFSYLPDYIYQYDNGGIKTYTNIDAQMFGGEAAAVFDFYDGLALEGGVSYQRGKKIDQPAGNHDKDLAEISPLKTKLALSYDKNGFFAVYEWIHSLDNDDVDGDAGETHLKGWDVFNFRAGYQFSEQDGGLAFLDGLSLNFGVDNMFDKKYAVANSYEYDVLNPGANVNIVNEPGRFIHGSLTFRF